MDTSVQQIQKTTRNRAHRATEKLTDSNIYSNKKIDQKIDSHIGHRECRGCNRGKKEQEKGEGSIK